MLITYSTHFIRKGSPFRRTTLVHLAEYEIKYLCAKSREIFNDQPMLLELAVPIKVCGK